MPKSQKHHGGLIDTWGRRNRILPDRRCENCKKIFRPLKKSSKYCSRPCAWANNGGHNKKPETWWTNNKGYIVGRIWIDGTKIFVRKHRWVMEKYLKRPLTRGEVVHHINGDRSDNRIENLEITLHGHHSTYHNKRRIYKKGYKKNKLLKKIDGDA
jgi:hypothetical protein